MPKPPGVEGRGGGPVGQEEVWTHSLKWAFRSSDFNKDHRGPLHKRQGRMLIVVQRVCLGGAGGWRMVQVGGGGEMPIPFLGSWCRVSGKGSLRQGRPLGSPQPACVSSFLRVGSSNIHGSRARRTGTYHSSAGGGGGRGRAGRLAAEAAADLQAQGEEAAHCRLPRPLHPVPSSRDQGARTAEPPKWMGPQGGRRRGDSVTPDQLMLPACNRSWVSGPYLSTISAADRLSPSLSLPPPRLWMRPQISVSISTSLLLCFIIHGRVGKSPTACLPSLAANRAPGP